MAKVVIFSGAGISAESGISTFRDSDGLWEKYKIEDICTAGCLDFNYAQTIDFYNQRREDIRDKKPNLAHTTMVNLQKKYPQYIQIITQNVDDLFEKAGAEDVIHLHGFLKNLKCSNPICSYNINIEYRKQNLDEICPKCSESLRPDIVFFGEAAPFYEDMYDSLVDCELLVVIGTSGNVIDVSYLLNSSMKYTILNNLEKSNSIDDSLFTKVLYKKATAACEKIAKDIENFIKNLKTQ